MLKTPIVLYDGKLEELRSGDSLPGGFGIGDLIGASPVPNGVLYADASGNLANSANLTFDGTTLDVTRSRINGASDVVQFAIKAYSSQTARPFEYQNSGGTYLFALDPSGNIDRIGGHDKRIQGNSLGVFFPDGILVATYTASSGAGTLVTSNGTAPWTFNSGATNGTTVYLKGFSSQTANFLTANDSLGNSVFEVLIDGKIKTSGGIELSDGKNFVFGSSTGTKIATGSTQKIGFFGATPVTQQPAIGNLTDLTGGSIPSSLQDADGGGGVASVSVINDNFSAVNNQLDKINTILNAYGLTA